MAGENEDHVVLQEGGKILAGGLLWQMDEDLFHLLVLGVRQEERNTGIGRQLLQEMCRPWKYCRDATFTGENRFPEAHMSVEEAIELGQKMQARQTVPTHLAIHYSKPVTSRALEEMAARHAGVMVAYDGTVFALGV